MKRFISVIIASFIVFSVSAQNPKGYEAKTAKLAENLVKCSKGGNYNKTYKALRSIQKYEYHLEKGQLVRFYTDMQDAVDKACDRYGIDSVGKVEMKIIVDALFSDELKAAVNQEQNN